MTRRWAIHTARGPAHCDADLLAAAVVEDTAPADYRCSDAELVYRAEARAGCWGDAVALVVAHLDAERRRDPILSTSYSTGELPW